MDKIMIPLAEGFEEIEAVTNIDVLRRAGIEVVTVSITEELEVEGDHGLKIKADEKIKNINSKDLTGVVLPGGMPGAKNLKNSGQLISLIQEVSKKKGLIAAICAAPMVLEKAGVLKDKDATSYPGFGEEMPSCNYKEEKVVIDGNIITGRGPGVALPFALELVAYLQDKNSAQQLSQDMIFEN